MVHNKSRQIIEYDFLKIPAFVEYSPDDVEKFLREVTISCQGKNVQIRERELNVTQIASAWKSLYQHAEEAVYETAAGELHLLFSHHENPPIRPNAVNTVVSDAIATTKESGMFFSSVANPQAQLHVDLSEFSVVNFSNDNQGIVEFVHEISKKLTPAYTISLSGDSTPFMLFVACTLAFPMSKVLEYRANGNSIRIS